MIRENSKRTNPCDSAATTFDSLPVVGISSETILRDAFPNTAKLLLTIRSYNQDNKNKNKNHCKEGYNRLTYMTQPKRSNENPMSNRRVGLNFLKSQIGVESKSIKQENCIDRGNPRRHRRRKSREKSGMRDHLGGLGRRGWVGLPSPQRIWIGIGIAISPFVGEEEREREVIL